MKINYAALSIISLAFVFQSCDKSKFPGYKESDNGLAYKFHIENKGEKPQEGDYITVKMNYKTDKDSVLFDSKTRPNGALTFPLQKPAFKGALEEGLAMMSIGDSASFKVLADSLFMKTFGMKEMPKGITPGSYLTFEVKMDKIQKEEELKQEQEADMNKRKDEEAAARNEYLKTNNITTAPTATGLIFIEQKKGTGKKAEAGKMVTVHYTGTLLDGTKFDSSKDHGQPFEFILGQGQVIPAWEEALSMMSEGGAAKLIIPSSIAYGAQQAGPIPPFSTLIFEVELVKVSDAPAAQAPQAAPTEPIINK